MTLIQELKRRNVFRVGVAYALAAWVLLQAADFVLQVIGAPGWILQVFVLAAAIGLHRALIAKILGHVRRREALFDNTPRAPPDWLPLPNVT
jgi:hypothetical protein